MKITKKDKLTFIADDIKHFTSLKDSLEKNIDIITKYYIVVLTAFFSYVVFYSNLNLNSKTQATYSFLGIFFVIFITTITYYTAFTLIKILKRRIQYRREITSLRSIANGLMDKIYQEKIICQLDSQKNDFSKFNNLPTIATSIGIAATIMLFLFLVNLLKVFKIQHLFPFQIAFSVTVVICLLVLAMMLNLYTYHRRAYLIAIKSSITCSEKKIKNQLNNINLNRKKRTTYQILQICHLCLIVFFIVFLVLPFFTNTQPFYDTKILEYFISQKNLISSLSWLDIATILESFIALLIAYVMIKKNRFLNMKSFHYVQTKEKSTFLNNVM